MSSDVQSALEYIVPLNYICLVMVTAVVYDFILTFSREIEYIWCKHWTWVSTMFVVIRYIGLCWVMISTVLMMILRVYAMWNRSRTILGVLLFIYVPQTIVGVVLDGIYNNPNTHVSVTINQILAFSFCSASYINTPATLSVYRIAPRFVLSAVLVILAVSQTLKQSYEMYKATKQWQPNRYMRKLVGDGILYFFVYVLISPTLPFHQALLVLLILTPTILTTKMFAPTYRNVFYHIYVLSLVTAPVNNTYTIFLLSTFLYIIFYIPIPRFIIGIRELYDHDISGRFHIDTGFGVVSQSNPRPDTTVSAIVFMGGNQGADVEGGTDNSGDLELGTVHGSGLNEGSLIGARE
ncbi:hypothetical protein EV363DRAFT_1452742 [Boletus edulis]|nr:hypothetical protein EV363DRAFT_1452742 [Boletus edulis]